MYKSISILVLVISILSYFGIDFWNDAKLKYHGCQFRNSYNVTLFQSLFPPYFSSIFSEKIDGQNSEYHFTGQLCDQPLTALALFQSLTPHLLPSLHSTEQIETSTDLSSSSLVVSLVGPRGVGKGLISHHLLALCPSALDFNLDIEYQPYLHHLSTSTLNDLNVYWEEYLLSIFNPHYGVYDQFVRRSGLCSEAVVVLLRDSDLIRLPHSHVSDGPLIAELLDSKVYFELMTVYKTQVKRAGMAGVGLQDRISNVQYLTYIIALISHLYDSLVHDLAKKAGYDVDHDLNMPLYLLSPLIFDISLIRRVLQTSQDKDSYADRQSTNQFDVIYTQIYGDAEVWMNLESYTLEYLASYSNVESSHPNTVNEEHESLDDFYHHHPHENSTHPHHHPHHNSTHLINPRLSEKTSNNSSQSPHISFDSQPRPLHPQPHPQPHPLSWKNTLRQVFNEILYFLNEAIYSGTNIITNSINYIVNVVLKTIGFFSIEISLFSPSVPHKLFHRSVFVLVTTAGSDLITQYDTVVLSADPAFHSTSTGQHPSGQMTYGETKYGVFNDDDLYFDMWRSLFSTSPVSPLPLSNSPSLSPQTFSNSSSLSPVTQRLDSHLTHLSELLRATTTIPPLNSSHYSDPYFTTPHPPSEDSTLSVAMLLTPNHTIFAPLLPLKQTSSQCCLWSSSNRLKTFLNHRASSHTSSDSHSHSTADATLDLNSTRGVQNHLSSHTSNSNSSLPVSFDSYHSSHQLDYTLLMNSSVVNHTVSLQTSTPYLCNLPTPDNPLAQCVSQQINNSSHWWNMEVVNNIVRNVDEYYDSSFLNLSPPSPPSCPPAQANLTSLSCSQHFYCNSQDSLSKETPTLTPHLLLDFCESLFISKGGEVIPSCVGDNLSPDSIHHVINSPEPFKSCPTNISSIPSASPLSNPLENCSKSHALFTQDWWLCYGRSININSVNSRPVNGSHTHTPQPLNSSHTHTPQPLNSSPTLYLRGGCSVYNTLLTHWATYQLNHKLTRASPLVDSHSKTGDVDVDSNTSTNPSIVTISDLTFDYRFV